MHARPDLTNEMLWCGGETQPETRLLRSGKHIRTEQLRLLMAKRTSEYILPHYKKRFFFISGVEQAASASTNSAFTGSDIQPTKVYFSPSLASNMYSL